MIALLCAAAIHLAAAYLPITGDHLGNPIPDLLASAEPFPSPSPSPLPSPSPSPSPALAPAACCFESPVLAPMGIGDPLAGPALPDPDALPEPQVGPSPNPYLPPTLLPDEFGPAQAESSPARPGKASASVTVNEPGGQTLVIWADHIEARTDASILIATGHVQAWYGSYSLSAGRLYFDAAARRGHADNHVRFTIKGYRLRADRFDFDLLHQEAQAWHWSGRAAHRGRASGSFLYLSPSYALARNTVFSPCMADDPGYFLSSKKLKWHPFGDRQIFEAHDVALHVSGWTLASIPEINTSLKDQISHRRGSHTLGAQAGYDPYEGAFAAGAGAFALGKYIQGTIPFRVTQGRGILFGTQGTAKVGNISLSGDATYQTPFQGGTYGPRANGGALLALAGGRSLSLGAGYRSDINGQNVNRLGDLDLNLGNLGLGPLMINPTARVGYFQELSPLPQLEWLPFDEPPHASAVAGSVHVAVAAPAWRPEPFWETDGYAWGTATEYLEPPALGARSWKPAYQVSGVVGLNNIQRWAARWSTDFGAETDQLLGRSPFYFDQAPSGDRVFGSASYAWTRHWYTDVGANFYRPQGALRLNFNDATLRLTYRAACLSWSLTSTMTLFPFNASVNFGYSVGLD